MSLLSTTPQVINSNPKVDELCSSIDANGKVLWTTNVFCKDWCDKHPNECDDAKIKFCQEHKYSPHCKCMNASIQPEWIASVKAFPKQYQQYANSPQCLYSPCKQHALPENKDILLTKDLKTSIDACAINIDCLTVQSINTSESSDVKIDTDMISNCSVSGGGGSTPTPTPTNNYSFVSILLFILIIAIIIISIVKGKNKNPNLIPNQSYRV
jgi:hypothetical protein